MQGRILDYSVQANEGIITGEDGFRYTFAGSQWQEGATPARGRMVDFEVDGASAIGVYHALSGTAAGATATDLPRSGIPTRQGQVLAYSVQDNGGIISGDDGVRYNFAGAEWREEAVPTREMRVDFAVDGTTAAAIYRTQTDRQGVAIGDTIGSLVGNLRAGLGGTPGTEGAAAPVEPGKRLVGYLIEAVLRFVTGGIISLVIGLPLGIATFGIGFLLLTFVWAFILFGYYWAMYATTGGGLGHLAAGSKLVNYQTGETVSVGRAAARAGGIAVVALIPFLPLLITFINGIMVLASDERRHLYDLIAGTQVVRRE